MDELIKFNLSIETRLLKEIEPNPAALNTSEKADIYGVVVTLWGESIGLLQSLERHATNALTTIIGGSGNIAILGNKRVSRRRFSDTDCSVEVSAVPITEGPASPYFSQKKLIRVRASSTSEETLLNHEIVKRFVNGVVSGGYTFHGIRHLPPAPIGVEVLRLAIAIKHDPTALAAAPAGGGGGGDEDEDDDDDDGEDDTAPRYVRRRSQKSQDAQIAKQLKKRSRKKPAQNKPNEKAETKPTRNERKDATDPGSSSNDAPLVPGAPATPERDNEEVGDGEVTYEDMFGEDDSSPEEEDSSLEEEDLLGLLMLK